MLRFGHSCTDYRRDLAAVALLGHNCESQYCHTKHHHRQRCPIHSVKSIYKFLKIGNQRKRIIIIIIETIIHFFGRTKHLRYLLAIVRPMCLTRSQPSSANGGGPSCSSTIGCSMTCIGVHVQGRFYL